MARLSTLKAYADNLVPMLDTGVYNVKAAATPPQAGSGSAIGDYVTLFAVNRAGRIIGAKLSAAATLGAACTVQLMLTRAGADVGPLTAATAAGGASVVTGAALANLDAQAGDLVELKVAGAVVAAAAVCTADVHLQH